MIKTGYKLGYAMQEQVQVVPHIVKVDVTDPACVSWQGVKKQLRAWHLDHAHALRGVTEKAYFEGVPF